LTLLYPLILSLSKDEPLRSWFDKLTHERDRPTTSDKLTTSGV